MGLLKIFGLFDFFTIIIFILLNNSLIPYRFGLMGGSYLVLKGLMFKGDFASALDLFCGVYLMLIPIFSLKFLTIFFVLYIGQKAVFTML